MVGYLVGDVEGVVRVLAGRGLGVTRRASVGGGQSGKTGMRSSVEQSEGHSEV